MQHPREAQRALQDRVVLAMLQGGWRAGWRLGLLTLIFTSTCQSLTVVRSVTTLTLTPVLCFVSRLRRDLHLLTCYL